MPHREDGWVDAETNSPVSLCAGVDLLPQKLLIPRNRAAKMIRSLCTATPTKYRRFLFVDRWWPV